MPTVKLPTGVARKRTVEPATKPIEEAEPPPKLTAEQAVKIKKALDLADHDHKVRVDQCEPNDWNMNVVSVLVKEKIRAGIRMMREKLGKTIPIALRPHPDPRKVADGILYQIIDGFHRWELCKEDGYEKIDADVYDVDTATAMLLTNTLNYLKGDPDPDKYVAYLHRYHVETGATVEKMSEFLPDTADEIKKYFDAYDLKVEHIEVPMDTEDGGVPERKEKMSEDFLELRFVVPKGSAPLIEQEISRIAGIIKGKMVRGRALEYMAVLSSQTPIEAIDSTKVPSTPETSEVVDLDDDDDEEPEEVEVRDAKTPRRTGNLKRHLAEVAKR